MLFLFTSLIKTLSHLFSQYVKKLSCNWIVYRIWKYHWYSISYFAFIILLLLYYPCALQFFENLWADWLIVMATRNAFNKVRFFKSDIRNIWKIDNILETYLCFCLETTFLLILLLIALLIWLNYTAFCYVWNKLLVLIYIFYYFKEFHLVEWNYLDCFILYWSFILAFRWTPKAILVLDFLKYLKKMPLLIKNHEKIA